MNIRFMQDERFGSRNLLHTKNQFTQPHMSKSHFCQRSCVDKAILDSHAQWLCSVPPIKKNPQLNESAA